MTRAFAVLGLIVAVLAGTAQVAAAQAVNRGDLIRISNYLNGISTLAGNFVQVGPDGDVSEGEFFLRRPGRLRFQYQLPNTALIIADGTWVGVCDRQVEVFERFPLSETPLELLLTENVDLRRTDAVQRVDRSAGQLRVTAIDPDAPEEGSITMIFSDNPLELRQWIILDPQGLTTTVALSEMRSNVRLGGEVFFISDELCKDP